MKKQILAGILSATMVVGMGVSAYLQQIKQMIKHTTSVSASSYSTKHWTLQHRDSKMRSQKNLAIK